MPAMGFLPVGQGTGKDMVLVMPEIKLCNLHLTDVNPVLCGTEQCAPGQSYGPAARGYFLLHYVVSGRGVLHSPRGTFSATAGDIFVIRPREITTYVADRAEPWRYYWIGFESGLALLPQLARDVFRLPAAKPLFVSLSQEHLPEGRREWAVCARVYELLSLLEGTALSQAIRYDAGAEYVSNALEYIQHNYMGELTVSGLASRLGLDRSYFCHLFKTHTGKSPQRFIIDYRLDCAAYLLASKALAPGEAATRVGYDSVCNFSRMFRLRFGVPPSHYQNGKKPEGHYADC